ncbi:MAG: four helix bundle protein [Minisyncoccota bacterium]
MKSMVKNFYGLKVWQDAHKITLDIYKTTKTFPHEEIFGLTSQMRRASSSISANIAEGFGRFHFKDKIRFYQQARGSAVELQNHLFLSQDLNYIKKENARKIFQEIEVVIKELNGLIRKTGETSNA